MLERLCSSSLPSSLDGLAFRLVLTSLPSFYVSSGPSLTSGSLAFCSFSLRSCSALALSPPACFRSPNPTFSFSSSLRRISACSLLSPTFSASLSWSKSSSSELWRTPFSAHSAISPISPSISTSFFSGAALFPLRWILEGAGCLDGGDCLVAVGSGGVSGCRERAEEVGEVLFWPSLGAMCDSRPRLMPRKSSSVSSWYIDWRTLPVTSGCCGLRMLLFSGSSNSPKSLRNREAARLRGLLQSSY